jgi:molecular chaperone GrpE
MTANEDERVVDKRPGSMDGEGSCATNGGGDSSNEEQPADLAEALEKADTYYKNWQRSAADFINFKRRVEQERGETARLASAALVINLLPIFDDLDRAVSSVDAQLAGLNWVQGIIAIERKFAQLMEAMNVHEVPAEGEQFDPAHHEAVGRQQGAEGRVLHVVQRGYMLGDKVIRPAMVIVGEGAAGG